MSSKIIPIDGIGDVTISKRKGSRAIRLSVSGSTVRVTQPTWLPFGAGEKFLRDKAEWIKEHLKPRDIFTEGQVVANSYSIQFRRSGRATVGSKVIEDTLTVLLPTGTYPEDILVQEYIRKKIRALLRDKAETYLPARVADLASIYGFRYKSVQVKLLKRRWGSCNSKRELVFNLNLMSLDSLHIDYVILHELTHTLHMNHGSDFWTHLESVFPNAKKIAKVVRRYNI